MSRASADALLWLIAVAGLILGAILTVAGALLFDQTPVPLIIGVGLLVIGAVALLVRLGTRVRD